MCVDTLHENVSKTEFVSFAFVQDSAVFGPCGQDIRALNAKNEYGKRF